MFFTSGKNVKKRACTNAGCGPTCSDAYCLNNGQTETIGVGCWKTGYETNGYIETTFKLKATDNSPPSIWLQEGTSVSISSSGYSTGSYVNRIRYSDSDLSVGSDYIRYSIVDDSKFTPWDYPGISRTGERLFYLNTGNGYIYVNQDLTSEYSYVFNDIVLCIADRRDSGICITMTITLTACYDIPTCNDQSKHDFWDTHTVGDTLFTFTYPSPAHHFPDFRSNWAGLEWRLVSSDLDVAEVDAIAGILRTSGNITVWPSYPSRSYYATIRVGNTESCNRYTTCTMLFTIYFTNWPIRFESLPTEMTVHENNDTDFRVHQIITYDYNNHYQDNVTCSMTFTPFENNMFRLDHDGGYDYNSWSIYRIGCLDLGCEFDCAKNRGCFTYGTTENHEFVFTVNCRDAYGSDVTSTFTLHLEDNQPPYFTADTPTYVSISKESHTTNSEVTRLITENPDYWVDNDFIRYTVTDDTQFIPWDYANISRVNDRLFYLNGETGYIYVNQDLSMEYSYVFRDIEFCIADRRDDNICMTITINLTACYEIPTCYDQEYYDFWDTHTVGEELFHMIYPDPTYHFPVDFRPDWLDLTWTIDDTDLAEAALDYNLGILFPSMNITVWPSWRYRDYYAVIRVNNAESCGRSTTCRMTFRIWFKNWPIRFISLPAEMTVNEDDDGYIFVHQIITYDYNYHLHDNVTCEMDFTPYEDNLFELRHDGRHDYDSWSIHRLACQEPECGFHCKKNIGCFTYNTTDFKEFKITIFCYDAYDSDVTDIFTLKLDYNRAPAFTNLPNTITLNSDKVSQYDILYSIQYSDNENEDMYYNFTFAPDNGIFNDILIFQCDGFGNYYNNLANITSTVYYHNMPETTYYIYICGTERRNMICETLTIDIKDECPGHPNCTGTTRDVPDTESVGTVLFTITGQQDASSSGTLSYSFISPTPAYFQIDQASGDISIAKPLVATYPSSSYQLTGFVYDSAACNYGSCQFYLTVTFTNYPISILNLPYRYENLPEDTEDSTALVVIETDDANSDDTVTCTQTDVTSPQTSDSIPQDLFRVKETYSGSMIYFIENRELPEFTAAITEYVISFECHDSYQSTAVGTLTVTIKPNETPVITNLNASIEVDHSQEGRGSIIYQVLTTDTENDPLTFTSTVDSAFVPLAITEAGAVYLRRHVNILREDGVSYSITICVSDPAHSLQGEVCGTLAVTFNSSEKYPVLDNLPFTVDWPENTTGGTTLYVVTVADENLDSVHTFSMTVDPPNARSMFSLDSQTGILLLQPGDSFNYEEQTIYTLTFSVQDQHLPGLERKDLIINVTNVNEEPTIYITQRTIAFDEDMATGTVLSRTVATCSDVDNPDTLSFSIENSLYSVYFGINETTSELSLAQEWDLETPLPITASINIICTDAGGLTSKQSISINVSPINEFDPVISPTTMNVEVTSETKVTDTLDQISSATDADFGDDNNFVYDIVGISRISYGKTYFVMTQSGELRIRTPIRLNYDKEFKFTISVSDEDSTPRPRTAYCTVTATYTAPAEQIPEKPTYCTTCTIEGKLIVASFVVEGCVLLIIAAHIIHHIFKVKSVATSVVSSTTHATNATLSDAPRNNAPRNIDPEDRDDDAISNDESVSEDSDIDERLTRNTTTNLRSPPRFPPFPNSVYSSDVSQNITTASPFTSGNYV